MVQDDVDMQDLMHTMLVNILVQLLYHDYVQLMDFEQIDDLNKYIYEMQLFVVLIGNKLLIDVDQMLFVVNNDEVNDEQNQEVLNLTMMMMDWLHELMVKEKKFLKNY
jgi:hypothetical protein